ncbi:MAG: lipid-A-disaccharide synthase [Bacteroidia bacterium]
MKYYLISGETSGDQHTAELINAIRTKDPHAQFRGMGGDACLSKGMELVIHQKEMAVMGFWEVIKQLPKISRVLRLIKKDIVSFEPDRVVLVDYPGFNLRIAKFAKKNSFAVHYYIAPKVWAWKEKRIKTIKKWVDHLYCILPFEEEYFTKAGINAHYVGNPSKSKVKAYSKPESSATKTIAILPGSRKQEITSNLNTMLNLKNDFEEYQFIVSQAPGFDSAFYHKLDPNLELESDMYKLLASADLAIVTSGTATLETALFRVPQIVCYKTSSLTYILAKLFVKVKYISLVNLILDKALIPELIQSDFNTKRMTYELNKFRNINLTEDLLEGYQDLYTKLGNQDPSDNVSEHLCKAET